MNASPVLCGRFKRTTNPAFVVRTRTEEVSSMSTMETEPSQPGPKTLAIRLAHEKHAQLSLIAKLKRHTITDEIREAIEAHLAANMANPELAAQAQDVLADIERDAEARREGITALFGTAQAAK